MIAVITALIVTAAMVGIGGAATWLLAALAVSAVVPASDLATAIVNRVITHQVGAMQLPGLELRDGVPDALRTLIAVPTLLTSPAAIAGQVEQLEVHYLGNPDDNFTPLPCCRIGPNSTTEETPDDGAVAAPLPPPQLRSSTRVIPAMIKTASCCCTAAASGTRAKANGSAGSANAANCWNSIACCAGRPTRRF